MSPDTNGGTEVIWFDADAELLEQLASGADYQDESIDEYVERACREKARQA